MRYSWDPKKAASNLKDHGVSFAEAAAALEDSHAQMQPDMDVHHEDRLRVLARSPKGRVLFVVVVEWKEDVLRIISARKADKREERTYAQGK